MLKAKNGKLISLNRCDEEMVYEAYAEGGRTVVYRQPYGCLRKAHCLLVTDADGNEVCALISKNVTRILGLTERQLNGEGMPLKDFILKYCPDFVSKVLED